jgi:hypothetical protein
MSHATKRTRKRDVQPAFPQLKKAPTGITGFDEITGGGLPAGFDGIDVTFHRPGSLL